MVWISLVPLQQLGGATWPKTSVAELTGIAEVVGVMSAGEEFSAAACIH